jgi:hypothetical protein
MSLDEVEQKLFEAHNGNIKMSNYSKLSLDAHFVCMICGYEWDTIAGNVIRGNSGCFKCAHVENSNATRHSDEYVKNLIESKNCEWISGDYKGANSYLFIKYPCGHTCKKSFTDFQAGGKCGICGRLSQIKTNLTKESDIIEIIESYGFKFLKFTDQYTGNQSYLEYQCQEGHANKKRWVNFQKNPACKKCSMLKRGEGNERTIEKAKKKILLKNCKWISGEYKTKQSELLIEFECGHQQWIPYYLFYVKKNNLCYECSQKADSIRMRKPIEEIVKLLEDNGLIFSEFIGEYVNNSTKIIYFCKEHHHKNIRSLAYIYKKTYCGQCFKQEVRSWYIGDKNHGWKGGISGITDYMRGTLQEWKRNSIASCKSRCVITGRPYDVVHHLYGFRLIAEKVFKENNILLREHMSEYSEEELNIIRNAVIVEHNKLLGVCLEEKVHKFFHKCYGSGNNTPEQFYEFQQRIQSGELILPT